MLCYFYMINSSMCIPVLFHTESFCSTRSCEQLFILALGALFSPGCAEDTQTCCMTACKMSVTEANWRTGGLCTSHLRTNLCSQAALGYVILHLSFPTYALILSMHLIASTVPNQYIYLGMSWSCSLARDCTFSAFMQSVPLLEVTENYWI